MNKIKEIAEKYIGQKEITGNRGFLDPLFETKMRSVGFYTGAPWCLFFVKLVWHEAGQNHSRVSSSSVQTMKMASKDKNWHTVPVVGAIAIFRMFKNGEPTSQGHGCIVTEIGKGIYTTVDGNTSDKNQREGIMVAIRNRHLNAESWNKNNGLRLMGFVYPK